MLAMETDAKDHDYAAILDKLISVMTPFQARQILAKANEEDNAARNEKLSKMFGPQNQGVT